MPFRTTDAVAGQVGVATQVTEVDMRRGSGEAGSEDSGAEPRGEELKYTDVQPMDHLRREGEVPKHAMHEATHTRRNGVCCSVRRAVKGESRRSGEIWERRSAKSRSKE